MANLVELKLELLVWIHGFQYIEVDTEIYMDINVCAYLWSVCVCVCMCAFSVLSTEKSGSRDTLHLGI